MPIAFISLLPLCVYLAWFPLCTAPYMAPRLFIVAGVVCYLLWKRSILPGTKPLRPGFIAIVGAAIISAFASSSPLLEFASRANSTTAGVFGLLLAWLCYEAVAKDDRDTITAGIQWGAAGCAAVALLQMLSRHGLIGVRAPGTFGSPPFASCMLALALPLFKPRDWRLWLVFVGLLTTQSRAGIVGAAAGLAVAHLSPARAVSTAALALGASILFIVRDLGDSMRVHTWFTAWAAFLARPWLGWGMENFADAYLLLRTRIEPGLLTHTVEDAHCLVLSILARGGVLGLAAWTYLGYRSLKSPASRTSVACLAAVLAYSAFNPVPFYAWCVLALLWGNET